MASRTKALDAARLVIVEFWDELSSTELAEFEQAVATAVGDSSDHDLLVYLHSGIEVTLSANNLRNFARHRRQFSEASRRVIVTDEQLLHGLARMYASEAHEVTEQFSIFHDLESAAEHLGLHAAALGIKDRST